LSEERQKPERRKRNEREKREKREREKRERACGFFSPGDGGRAVLHAARARARARFL